MNTTTKAAARAHQNVPPDWYFSSMKRNLFQWMWHKKRFSIVGDLVEPSGGKILDIGCADGMFTKVVADRSGGDVIGIDVLKSSVKWASDHWKNKKNMHFKVGNAHKLDFKDRTFDAVFALEVMEHVPQPDQVIKEMKRVLKKNGYVIVLVPTDSTLFRGIWWFVTNFWWAKIWDETHVQSFTSTNPLSKHMTDAGLKVEVDKKFWFGMLNVVKARKIK